MKWLLNCGTHIRITEFMYLNFCSLRWKVLDECKLLLRTNTVANLTVNERLTLCISAKIWRKLLSSILSQPFFKHHKPWLGNEEMVFDIFQPSFMILSIESILGLANSKVKSTLDQKTKNVPTEMKQLSREVKLGHRDQRK